MWRRRPSKDKLPPLVEGADSGMFLIDVLVRPEALYVCSHSQDVRGSWWANDHVTRVDTPARPQVLADALALARAVVRRDLPAPASWAESPDNPRPAALVALAPVTSAAAFFRGASGFSVEYRRSGVTITALEPVPGGYVGGASEESAVADDDLAVAREVLSRLNETRVSGPS